jgi:hypothetical protein
MHAAMAKGTLVSYFPIIAEFLLCMLCIHQYDNEPDSLPPYIPLFTVFHVDLFITRYLLKR